MENRKKLSGKRYYIVITVISLLLILSIVLFAFSIFSILAFFITLILLTLGLFTAILLLVKYKKRLVEQVKLKKKDAINNDEEMIKLYNLAGIPVIRDENGKIKNIFELLGIEPVYDLNGNRVKTVYELLGIVPRFDKDGKEIPTILSIKNRALTFVKPAKQTGMLTRVLTPEQKEELLMKQMLEEKLKESQQVGDDKKAKVIKKVIQAKKKEAAKPSATKPAIIKLASGKIVTLGSPKLATTKAPNYNVFADLLSLTAMPKVGKKVTSTPSQSVDLQGEKQAGFSRPQQNGQYKRPVVVPYKEPTISQQKTSSTYLSKLLGDGENGKSKKIDSKHIDEITR